MNSQVVPNVPEIIDFPREEEKILEYWREIEAFKKSIAIRTPEKPRFSFYDGPPFAVGEPHYGHLLAGTVKDVVTRYFSMLGYHVERRFGWDCHGLPVEIEVDNLLGIKGPEDVKAMGISKYNKECRKLVGRYADEWENLSVRLGRWIDFENDYKTMYTWYMESIWWVFSQLFQNGMIYEGFKVMPYSNACHTPLSNFEATQNYKDVSDPSIVVSMPIIGDPDQGGLLIWTTAPWTLISNLALCVNPSLMYAKIRVKKTRKVYIIMQKRVTFCFKESEVEHLAEFPGEYLKNVLYCPIFDYYKHLQTKGAFRVVTDEYVAENFGTGVVHLAPYFGEEDYRICLDADIITREQAPVAPLDASGHFIKPISDFEGLYIMDANRKIIDKIHSKKRLLKHTTIMHSYPFCWRSDTRLIFRAVPSWYVRVGNMRDDLLKTVAKTHWVPGVVKEKRFKNWLREARDWAISRNRYWGTPIPIWRNENEILCVGSIADLEKMTGVKIKDIHREYIDQLEIPSKTPGNPPLKRIPEVFDCWFESGCMPYAQDHYPFAEENKFPQQFPADFIAEGIDQTRGWFYTLLVVSTALMSCAPFRNVITHGLMLARDGQKMSKRKKNYPDPMNIIAKYGADSLRLYLVNSPALRGENLKFKEEEVRDVIKDFMLPWYNAFRFLMQNIDNYVKTNEREFYYQEKDLNSSNIMDQWILSCTNSLIKSFREEMGTYHICTVVPKMIKFMHNLTNWYIRMNRPRLKGETNVGQTKQALRTLFGVIYNFVILMAPFTPFLSEYMFQVLKKLTYNTCESVHHISTPLVNKQLIDKSIEKAVVHMQSVIELGRTIREKNQIQVKHPLQEIIVVHESSAFLKDISILQTYILSEINVKKITMSRDTLKYGATIKARPSYISLGSRLKNDMQMVGDQITNLTVEKINELTLRGEIEIGGHIIKKTDIHLDVNFRYNSDRYVGNTDNNVLVLIDLSHNQELQDEGTSREIVNRIQKMRKKAQLNPTDVISVFYKTSGDLERVCKEYEKYIEKSIRASFRDITLMGPTDTIIINEDVQVHGNKLSIIVTKYANIVIPVVRWANLELVNIESIHFDGSNKGLILMEVGGVPIGLEHIRELIFTLFGIQEFDLWTENRKLECDYDLMEINGDTIFITPINVRCNLPMPTKQPYCKVINFEKNSVAGTVIIENPQGSPILSEHEIVLLIEQHIQLVNNIE